MVLVLAALAVAVVAIAGCSSEQRRAFGEQDLRDSLDSRTTAIVAANDSGDVSLACAASIGTDSAVDATCTGTTDTGDVVEASFTGTADVDAETCEARLVVRIDGDDVADRPDVRCFDAV
jgi:hypothetical protein